MLIWFRRYLMPGLVFQSIIIAGGYGTGRELVEFFLQYGPVSGVLGMLLPTTLLMSATCMVSFELARISRCYDYRNFLKLLLGRAWFLYEIGFLTTVLLVLAVIGAAAGALLVDTFGISAAYGSVGLLLAIAFLAYKGTEVIEGFLSIWSFVLYGVYITVFAMSMIKFGPEIAKSLSESSPSGPWVSSGLRYAALNLALVPAILFATKHITKRREALIAGALAGPIAIIPGILFLVAMLGHYPAILEQPIPANYLLQMIGSPVLQITFQIVLIGTFLETGAGLIHAFNERIAGAFTAAGKTMPDYLRPVTPIVLLTGAAMLSRFGLIDLIAVGYGSMTWVFIAVLILPLATVGIWRITRARNTQPALDGGQ